MRTIRGKLLVYFFVFVILFQAATILIFISSNNLTNNYNDSFRRFLLLNTISQETVQLFTDTKLAVTEPKEGNVEKYYHTKGNLEEEKKKLTEVFHHIDKLEMKNYINLIETFIHESELAVGFSILDNVEQYTHHLHELRNSSQYVQESTLEIIDMELTAYHSLYQDLQTRNESFLLFFLFLFLTTSMLAIFFALWFSRGITNPVGALSSAAREVARGEFEGKPVVIETNDELRLLGEAFNSMRLNIHRLVNEIKDQSELDRLVKEMELKHLQNQINPHFLFNTLNTLSKLAYLEDAKSTSNLIDSVATLLRYSLGDITKSVTLEDEVEVVKDYFQIQKTRFAERVVFQHDIDPSCLAVGIPRLILQPLVENAFIHGIESKEEGGTITLTIYSKEQHVIVEVHDDGVGMKEGMIDRIMSQTDEQMEHIGHSTGIGLSNVIRRLQLFYKKHDVVEIDSEVGKGTTIRVFLPIQDVLNKGENVNENHHSGR